MPCRLRGNNGPRRLRRITERGSTGRVARQPVQSRLGRCQPDGVSDQLRARSRLESPSNNNVPSWEQADEAAGHGARGTVHHWHLGWRPCQVTGPEAETRHGEWYSLACPGGGGSVLSFGPPAHRLDRRSIRPCKVSQKDSGSAIGTGGGDCLLLARLRGRPLSARCCWRGPARNRDRTGRLGCCREASPISLGEAPGADNDGAQSGTIGYLTRAGMGLKSDTVALSRRFRSS